MDRTSSKPRDLLGGDYLESDLILRGRYLMGRYTVVAEWPCQSEEHMLLAHWVNAGVEYKVVRFNPLRQRWEFVKIPPGLERLAEIVGEVNHVPAAVYDWLRR